MQCSFHVLLAVCGSTLTLSLLKEYAAQIANADQMLSVFAEFVPEEDS